MTTKTLEDLDTVLAEFSAKVEKIRNTPSEVDEAFRQAAKYVAAAEGGTVGALGGAILGYIYGSVTEDDFTGTMQRNKKEIKNKIVELLASLQAAIDGLRAPIAFLQSSGAWLSVQTEINVARNWIEVNADLRGNWSGSAADAYFAKKQLQITAHETLIANCATMSTCLVEISDASWTFYSKIVSDLAKFFIDFAAALTKIATGIAAPVGIGDAIDAAAWIIQKVVDYSLELGSALRTQRANINQIEGSIDNPKGFHNNKWPSVGASDVKIDAPNNEKWAAR
ncbi:hypothetical protein [Nocardia lasii]|uniref:WXG100 family type VII secretion target n=1 Tax=Nocardia lasii TaxID=1616107 RepID=A0ABW1JZ60_9NOCA